MSDSTITQGFGKGINQDASPFVLDLNQCETVKNMLFERGLLQSRPGLHYVTSGTLGGVIRVVNFPRTPVGVSGFGLVVMSAPTGAHNVSATALGNDLTKDLLQLQAALSITQAIGLNYSDVHVRRFYKYYVICGLASPGASRMLLVDSAKAVTIVQLPFARNYYATPHLSRMLAVSANSSLNDTPTLYWSAIGNAQVWNPATNETAGSTPLQDATDGVTGIEVIRNVVVIARPFGFHLGVASGDSLAPYDLKSALNDTTGVAYPRTLCRYGEKLYYVSACGVHTFDLENIESIGEGIQEELFSIVKDWNANYTLRGYMTMTYKGSLRPQYHIVPISINGVVSDKTTSTIHFCYDILEQKWSRHVYDKFSADTIAPDSFALNYVEGGVNYYSAPAFVRQTVGADIWVGLLPDSVDTLEVSCNNPPAGVVGTLYTHQISISGGTPPYTVEVIG